MFVCMEFIFLSVLISQARLVLVYFRWDQLNREFQRFSLHLHYMYKYPYAFFGMEQTSSNKSYITDH